MILFNNFNRRRRRKREFPRTKEHMMIVLGKQRKVTVNKYKGQKCFNSTILNYKMISSLSKIHWATRYRATYHLYPRTKPNSAGREGGVKKSRIGWEKT
ncbi:hypothetical protein QL285_031784 [Trifolium repens]|nr:hypothetical protein QL285_031784 [Trifolium repens]